MKTDDLRALWAVRRYAADDAAQKVVQADAEHADAESALADFRARIGAEAERTQGLGPSGSLALWYGAAARRLQDLATAAVERAEDAAAARASLRAALTEAERVGTVSEQLDRQRRAALARHAQGQLDELGLRRSRRRR